MFCCCYWFLFPCSNVSIFKSELTHCSSWVTFHKCTNVYPPSRNDWYSELVNIWTKSRIHLTLQSCPAVIFPHCPLAPNWAHWPRSEQLPSLCVTMVTHWWGHMSESAALMGCGVALRPGVWVRADMITPHIRVVNENVWICQKRFSASPGSCWGTKDMKIKYIGMIDNGANVTLQRVLGRR